MWSCHTSEYKVYFSFDQKKKISPSLTRTICVACKWPDGSESEINFIHHTKAYTIPTKSKPISTYPITTLEGDAKPAIYTSALWSTTSPHLRPSSSTIWQSSTKAVVGHASPLLVKWRLTSPSLTHQWPPFLSCLEQIGYYLSLPLTGCVPS
jgi:hypothetical protein